MGLRFWRGQSERKVDEGQEVKAAMGLSEGLASLLSFGTSTSAATAQGAIRIYETCSAVHIPVEIVVNTFATIPPVLRVKGKVVREHPMLDLLNKPSPDFTGTLLREVLATNFLVAGEAFLVGLGGVTRPPLELQPISPTVISHTPGELGTVGQFLNTGEALSGNYTRTLKKNRRMYLRGGDTELRQIRGFSTKNGSLMRGQSPLISAAAEARQHILGTGHNISLLEKGGRLSLLFHYKQKNMSRTLFNETLRRVRDQFGGSDEAGAIGVTSGDDLDIKEMGVNNKDMDWGVLQSTAAKVCALTYRVPLPLIGESATFSNFAAAMLALYDYATIPLSKQLYGGLSDFLMPRYGMEDSGATLEFDAQAVTALVSRQVEELGKRKSLYIDTTDEMRGYVGADPAPLGAGTSIMVPSSLVPLGSELLGEEELEPEELAPEEEEELEEELPEEKPDEEDLEKE